MAFPCPEIEGDNTNTAAVNPENILHCRTGNHRKSPSKKTHIDAAGGQIGCRYGLQDRGRVIRDLHFHVGGELPGEGPDRPRLRVSVGE